MDSAVTSVMQGKNGNGDFYCFFIGEQEMANFRGIEDRVTRQSMVLLGNAVMKDGKIILWNVSNEGFGLEKNVLEFSPKQVLAVLYEVIPNEGIQSYLIRLEKDYQRKERARCSYGKENQKIFFDARLIDTSKKVARLMNPIYFEATEDDPSVHYMVLFREGFIRKAGWNFSEGVTELDNLKEVLSALSKEAEEDEGSGMPKKVVSLSDYAREHK